MLVGVALLAVAASFMLFPISPAQRAVATAIDVSCLVLPVAVGIFIAHRARTAPLATALAAGLVTCGMLVAGTAALFQEAPGKWSIPLLVGGPLLLVLGAAVGRLHARRAGA
jgi:hypothetical protein